MQTCGRCRRTDLDYKPWWVFKSGDRICEPCWEEWQIFAWFRECLFEIGQKANYRRTTWQ